MPAKSQCQSLTCGSHILSISYFLAKLGIHWVFKCGEVWPPWFPAAWLAELDRICSVICWEPACASVSLSAFLVLNIIRCHSSAVTGAARYQTKLLRSVRDLCSPSSWASGSRKPLMLTENSLFLSSFWLASHSQPLSFFHTVFTARSGHLGSRDGLLSDLGVGTARLYLPLSHTVFEQERGVC